MDSRATPSSNLSAVSQAVPVLPVIDVRGVQCTAAFRGLQEELQETRAELERVHRRYDELECENEALTGEGHTEEVERLRAQLRVREQGGLSKPGPEEVEKLKRELNLAQQRE